MSALTTALLADLTEADLDRLAELLRPRLSTISPDQQPQSWLSVQSAADHLACPKSRLYALVSARRIPFHKDGSRTLFDRDELDEWVRAGGATRP